MASVEANLPGPIRGECPPSAAGFTETCGSHRTRFAPRASIPECDGANRQARGAPGWWTSLCPGGDVSSRRCGAGFGLWGSHVMGSRNGRNRRLGADVRRSRGDAGRQARPRIETLESRRLLSGTTISTAVPAPIWSPTDTNLFDAQNGPMADLGVDLVSIYRSAVEGGGGAAVAGGGGAAVANSASLASRFPRIEFVNGLVGMQVKSLGGDFDSFVAGLEGLGMQVTTSSADYGLVRRVPPGGRSAHARADAPGDERRADVHADHQRRVSRDRLQRGRDRDAGGRRPGPVRRDRDRSHGGRRVGQRQPVRRWPGGVICDGRPQPEQPRDRNPGRAAGIGRRRPGDAGEHP